MSDQEITNQDLLNAIGTVQKDVKGVKDDTDSLKQDMKGVQEAVHDSNETIDFIKDNAAAKSDVQEIVQAATSEIITHVDGFIGLHKKLEEELVALRSKYDRLEDQLQQVAKHLQLDLH